METWIEEFLFRGRPPSGPGSEMPVTFQVIVGRQIESRLTPGKFERELSPALTPEQAAAAPYNLDLGALVAGINAAAVGEAMALGAAIEQAAALQEALEAAQDRTAAVEAEAAALRDRLASLAAPAAPAAPSGAPEA
jgi:hypothetical protein